MVISMMTAGAFLELNMVTVAVRIGLALVIGGILERDRKN